MKKVFGLAVAATMVIGGVASADIIYDNPVGAGGGTAVNQEFGDFPTFSTYLVADLTIGNPGFTLTSISMPLTIQPLWGGVNQARLHIFAKTGPLPVGADDPAASGLVPVLYDVQTGVLSTVGLDVDVPAGDYWIGLTPLADFGAQGQAFTQEGLNANGDSDAARNPDEGFVDFPPGGNWFSIESFAAWGWHSFALTVEGVPIPAPGALALLGVAGLITRRRRCR